MSVHVSNMGHGHSHIRTPTMDPRKSVPCCIPYRRELNLADWPQPALTQNCTQAKVLLNARGSASVCSDK